MFVKFLVFNFFEIDFLTARKVNLFNKNKTKNNEISAILVL